MASGRNSLSDTRAAVDEDQSNDSLHEYHADSDYATLEQNCGVFGDNEDNDKELEPTWWTGGDEDMTCQVCQEPGEKAVTESGWTMACNCNICMPCLESWARSRIVDRAIRIPCPTLGCNVNMPDDMALDLLDGHFKEKYLQYQAEIQRNPYVKTCPDCGEIHTATEEERRMIEEAPEKGLKNGKSAVSPLSVTCTKCGSSWCFTCHSPLHPGLSCHQMAKRDKAFRKWNRRHGSWCPACECAIQKTAGCNHMYCLQCGSHYCYRCGEGLADGDVAPVVHDCRKVPWRTMGKEMGQSAATVGLLAICLAVVVPVCVVGGVVVGAGYGIHVTAKKSADVVRQVKRKWRASSSSHSEASGSFDFTPPTEHGHNPDFGQRGIYDLRNA